jgi:hypothetical protein
MLEKHDAGQYRLFHQETAEQVAASYKLTLLVSKEKHVYTTGDTTVKLHLLSAANVVLGTDSQECYRNFTRS